MKKYFVLLFLILITASSWAQKTVKSSHPWANKRVAYFGDSITDPNNDGSKNKYWNFLQDWLGITPYVYGISGREWNDVQRQADKLKAEHGNDFDAITIFMGTNDYNAAVPIGKWYNEVGDSVVAARGRQPRGKYYLMRRSPALDNGTFRGRINIAMKKLKAMFPDKQIVLLTPIHRAYFEAGSSNVQPSEDFQNGCGEYLDSYVKSVKEAGEIWSVPVIDLYSVSGFYPLDDNNAKLYSHKTDTDRLHPNDAGHARIAKTLVYQLFALPCTFE